jgi:hypothetical protein
VLEELLSAFRAVEKGLSGTGVEAAASEDVKALEAILSEREADAAAAVTRADQKAVALLASWRHPEVAPPAS